MELAPKCLVCGSATEEGFLPDVCDHAGTRHPQEWWGGVPRASFWMGVKKPDVRYGIRAYRCSKCGFLMSFAAEKPAG